MAPPTSDSPRRAILELLDAWYRDGDLPSRSGLRASGLVMEVVYGVLRNQRWLDACLKPLTDRPPPARIRTLLRAAAYQVLFLNPADRFAVVHESVDLARERGGQAVAGFVNAVLRRLAGQADSLPARMAGYPLEIRYSLPDVLIRRWRAAYPAPELEALCEWNNRRPELTFRVVEPSAMPEILAGFAARGVEAAPHPFQPDRFLVADMHGPVTDLPAFVSGRLTIQDPSTSVAPGLAAVEPGMTVLDACAAPGGKCAMLAEACGTAGRCVAVEANDRRAGQLAETLTRLHLDDRVPVVIADAASPRLGKALAARSLPERYDVVLADVPCSNTGVLRRRVEARWRFSETALSALVDAQRRLLDALAERVNPGGVLVYSTCSLEPEENRGQVEEFLARHPGWRSDGERSTFPPRDGVDGAYAARLRKPA